MARKVKDELPTNGRGNGKSQLYGDRVKWVNGYLNEEDKQWLDANRSKISEYILAIIAEQSEGYKLSCKFESTSGQYQSSLIPDDPDCVNSGFGLSHRANDPTVSLFVLSYKHFVKFERRWGEIEPASKPRSDWD